MTVLFLLLGTALGLLLAVVAGQALYDLFSRWSFEDTRDEHTTAGRSAVWMRPATAAESHARACLCDHRRQSQASVLAAIDASLRTELARHRSSYALRPSPVP